MYSLKTFTFEKVRARNFSRAWGYIQCSHAIPMVIGVPLTGKCGSTLLLTNNIQDSRISYILETLFPINNFRVI